MLVRLKSLVQGKAGHGHVLPMAIGALIKARNHLSKKPETLTIAPTVPVAKSMPKKPPKAVTEHTPFNISIPPPMPDYTTQVRKDMELRIFQVKPTISLYMFRRE